MSLPEDILDEIEIRATKLTAACLKLARGKQVDNVLELAILESDFKLVKRFYSQGYELLKDSCILAVKPPITFNSVKILKYAHRRNCSIYSVLRNVITARGNSIGIISCCRYLMKYDKMGIYEFRLLINKREKLFEKSKNEEKILRFFYNEIYWSFRMPLYTIKNYDFASLEYSIKNGYICEEVYEILFELTKNQNLKTSALNCLLACYKQSLPGIEKYEKLLKKLL